MTEALVERAVSERTGDNQVESSGGKEQVEQHCEHGVRRQEQDDPYDDGADAEDDSTNPLGSTDVDREASPTGCRPVMAIIRRHKGFFV